MHLFERTESARWTVARWLPAGIKEDELDALSLPTGFGETNELVPLSALPVQTARD